MTARRRREWLGRVGFGLALVGLAFAALQLWLASPWARRWVAQRLEARIGLEVDVGRLSWSPWGGVVIRDLRVIKPEGLPEGDLVLVERVRVWPDYSALLRGRKRLNGIDLQGPQVEIDGPLLAFLMQQGLQSVAKPPVLAGVATEEPTSPERRAVIEPVEPGPETSGEGPAAGGTPKPPSGSRPAGKPIEKKPDAPARPQWLTVHGGSVVLRLGQSGHSAIRLENLSGCLPLAGLQAGVVRGRLASDLIEKNQTTVSFKSWMDHKGVFQTSLKIADKNTQNVVLQTDTKYQKPFFELRGELVSSDQMKQTFRKNFGIQLEDSGLRWRGHGVLAHPATWQIFAEGQTAGLSLQAPGQTVEFDQGLVEFGLARGQLRLLNLRLLGSTMSMLGNGWFDRSGAALVVRLTVPTADTEFLNRRLKGVAWQRLRPGSLSFADLTLWPDPSGVWWVELGQGGRRIKAAAWMMHLQEGLALGR